MIRLSDATRLAATKLRTRKVRLVITIVIAGLLFSALSAASQVSRGAFASLSEFNKEGFGERFIVLAFPQASGNGPSGSFTTDPAVLERALTIQKERVAKKTAEAKRLGVPYDSKSEPPVVEEFDSPNGKQRTLSVGQPAADQAIREHLAAHPAPGRSELLKQAAPYGSTDTHQSKSLPVGPSSPTLKLIKDGMETFEAAGSQDKPSAQSGLDSFTQSWGLMSRDLMTPFLLPGASTTVGRDGSIPLVAPHSAVEQLQGLKALPSTAKPAERLERIKQVRAGADSITFQVCARSPESAGLVSQAISQQQEIERNKNDKTYVKPSRQYGLPTKPCSAAPVIRDVRTAAEKKAESKNEQFEQIFGKQAPSEQLLTFRVVGISPDPPNFNASVINQIVSSLVSSNLGFGAATWYTPLELEGSLPALSKLFADPTAKALGASQDGNYLEFASAAGAKKFMDEQTCQPDFSGITGPDSGGDPFAACAAAGKNFGFMPFGSNALALEDAKYWFNRIFGYAALAVAAIAAIIMIGTVGRIIADSRRETAVFRAIGAKKLDIALTYLIYTLFLSLLIFGFALALGFALAQFVDTRYAAEFTVQSLVAYNAQDLSKQFSLYAFHAPDILKLLGLSLAGGLLSATFPLLRNLRRNPIRDMRDDT